MMLRQTAALLIMSYLTLTCAPIEVDAQGKLSYGAQIGGNLSQVDGDSFEGFHKLGVRIGLRAEYEVRDPFAVVLEANYEEKGSSFGSHAADNKDRDKKIKLDYLEIPLMIKWTPRSDMPFFVEAGASAAVFLQDEIVQDVGDPSRAEIRADRSKFRSTEFNAMAGVGWRLTEQLSALVRYSYAIQALVRDDEALAQYLAQPPSMSTIVPLFHLRNYQISVGVAYLFEGGQGGKRGLGCPTF